MAITSVRVVPTIDGNPTFIEISLRWIDAVGNKRSDVSIIDGKATDAQIEAVVANSISMSVASLHTVRVTKVYAGEISKSNAESRVHLSVDNNIVYHAKNVARENRRAYAPSPWEGRMIPDTETPDATDATVINWMSKWDAVWAGTFAGRSLRYSQRKDSNKAVDT